MKKIVVLATGGTIAGASSSAGDGVAYRAGEVPVGDLLAQVSGLQDMLGRCALAMEQVAQVNSKDMDYGLWRQLARRCSHWLSQDDVSGLVITHGTDTLEETAWFLQRMLDTALPAGVLHAGQARKPVVLSSAMRPSTARLSDGPQNLADAVSVLLDARATGVLAVAAGRVHAASDVHKVQPYRLDAFSSGDAGVLAHVEEGRVRWLRDAAAHAGQPGELAMPGRAQTLWRAVQHADTRWPWVEILTSHAGHEGRSLLACRQAGVQGVVLAGSGNATLHERVEQAAASLMQHGIPVWRSSRCLEGSAVPGAESVVPLAISCGQVLRPVQARTEMVLQWLAGVLPAGA